MEKQRKIKILSIVALVLAICALSLGYAAFSTSLNISSRATVSPSSSDFSLVFSPEAGWYDTEIDWDLYGTIVGNAAAKNATVSGHSVWGLGANFTAPGESVTYTFYIHNTGEYDAYLTSIWSTDPTGNGTVQWCEASTSDETKATDSLIQAACNGIGVSINIDDNEFGMEEDYIAGVKIEKGTSKKVEMTIFYNENSSYVDGPFNVLFGDTYFEFSTVDNVKIVSFDILGLEYQGADGSTWGDWVNSDYNIEGYVVRDDGQICESSDSSSKCLFTCEDFCGYVTSDMQIFESVFTMN